MRTYGRIPATPLGGPPGSNISFNKGPKKWVVVTTDAKGFNDMVMLTALAQVLLLNAGESPFYADWGIAAAYSVLQQVFPDFEVVMTQKRFAAQFASLIIAKVPDPTTPVYRINIVTHAGLKIDVSVPIPL
jgi:hypothetical protein